MRRHKKQLLGVMLAAALCLVFSGCALVSVNPERDRAQVIATVNGEDITKDTFNNAMAYTEMYYESQGQNMPTGSDLTDLKQSIFDEIIQNAVLAAQAKKDGLKVDEASAKKSGDESYTSIKKEMDKKYDSILSDNYTTDELFKAYLEDSSVTAAYADKAQTAYDDKLDEDSSSYMDEAVGKIGDTDVSHAEYQYYLISQELQYYITNGTALDTTDDSEMKDINDTIFNDIATNHALIQYAEDNDIEVKDSAVTSAQKSLQSTMSTYFQDDDSLEEFLSSYYMPLKTYKKYQKEEAKANAASDAIEAKLEDDVEVTDSALKKYYNDNKDDYDSSTVSACHILTSDETLADEIYQKCKDVTSKEDFEKVMEKYKDTDGVTEATDLGSFTKSDMVEEFSDAAFSQDVNTVSKPVQTDYGYHIIFVYDKQEAEETSWEDYKDELTTDYKSSKASEELDKLKENLLDDAGKIEIYDIKTADEEYIDQLKETYNVTTYEKRCGL